MLELLQDDVQVFPALGIRVELVVIDHYLALKKEPVKAASRILIFLLLAQSVHLFLMRCVTPHIPTDGLASILSPNSCAATGNQTRVSSVAPLLRDLTQDTLPTELLQLRQLLLLVT